MGWLNGKWVTLRIKDKTKLSVGWSKWEETKGQDWACYICDPYVDDATDFDLGNYASDKLCRGCDTPKGQCQQMLMSTRTWRKKLGALKPREESKEERLRRHEAKQQEKAQKEQGGWTTTASANRYVDNQPQENTEAWGEVLGLSTLQMNWKRSESHRLNSLLAAKRGHHSRGMLCRGLKGMLQRMVPKGPSLLQLMGSHPREET